MRVTKIAKNNGTPSFELVPVGPTGPNAVGVVGGIKPPELELELQIKQFTC